MVVLDIYRRPSGQVVDGDAVAVVEETVIQKISTGIMPASVRYLRHIDISARATLPHYRLHLFSRLGGDIRGGMIGTVGGPN
ncbi:uncharacterized protein STEHIDRAFT_126448 [Stereum hirsutum FP-91666 SS1]|uniref:Uncharacterized protein n=1 Tax=Stereum hirsutum (strain FP-91666) TaxID=721885 RepID=R7RZ37_STEHR|nr:uncharacterized protein STEHIDRAFT_126448 [Stereum hirsutum FP-91666 SS1]EIM79577.1 hypothetical protein STEHIDRAFT_126448 [Stereum hirsutum FP-91666 SS1]